MSERLRCSATTRRGKRCNLPAAELWARVPFCWRHSPRLHYERQQGCELRAFAERLARVEAALKGVER